MNYYVCLLDVKLRDNDLKNIKICRSLGRLYVKVYLLILGHLFVLSIKKFVIVYHSIDVGII
jgi:hypothetical protein